MHATKVEKRAKEKKKQTEVLHGKGWGRDKKEEFEFVEASFLLISIS